MIKIIKPFATSLFITGILVSVTSAGGQDLGGDLALHKLLIDGEKWQLVVDGLGFADAPCGDDKGNFYYSDMRSREGLFKVTPDGRISPLFPESVDAQSISGAKFGPDGRLYCCQGKLQRVIAFEIPSGKMEVLAENVRPNDLIVSHDGYLFLTETPKKQITMIHIKTKEVVAVDIGSLKAPNGLTLSPGQDTLAVSDYRGRHVWTFRIGTDGLLDAQSPYMTVRTTIKPEAERAVLPTIDTVSRGDGMTMDENGRYYVATALGLQVFDPTGRECGLIPKPTTVGMTSVFLGGPDGNNLYATCRDKIFKLKVKARGLFPWMGSIPTVPVPFKR